MDLFGDIPFHDSPESSGLAIDLIFLDEEKWLLNTEVRYRIWRRNGMWELSMIYISITDPLKFICRVIDSYNSETKANTFASIMQRGIGKDVRGTLKTNRDALNFCDN